MQVCNFTQCDWLSLFCIIHPYSGEKKIYLVEVDINMGFVNADIIMDNNLTHWLKQKE